MRKARFASVLAGASLMLLTLSPSAHAEPSQKDLREAMELFSDGVQLLRQQDWTRGCQRFEESAARVPRPSNLAKIGICRRHERRYVAAWLAFQEARRLNDADPQSRRRELEQEIQDELSGIPVLRIDLATPPTGLSIELDHEALPAESWPLDHPLELGSHELVARAPGYEAVTIPFQCDSEQTQTIRLRLVARDVEPAPSTARTVSAVSSRRVSAAPSGRRSAGIVLAALGATGLLASGVLGIVTLTRVHDSNGHCAYADGSCDERGVELRSSARSFQTVGVVVGSVSALAVGAGAYLCLAAPKHSASAHVQLNVALLPTSMAVEGRLSW
jgi:hypothetical protein